MVTILMIILFSRYYNAENFSLILIIVTLDNTSILPIPILSNMHKRDPQTLSQSNVNKRLSREIKLVSHICIQMYCVVHLYWSVRLFSWAGFNPVWNETFTFTVQFPDLCLLRFVVYDSDTISDDFIGQYTLPLDSVEKGDDISCVTVIDHEMYLVKYVTSKDNIF